MSPRASTPTPETGPKGSANASRRVIAGGAAVAVAALALGLWGLPAWRNYRKVSAVTSRLPPTPADGLPPEMSERIAAAERRARQADHTLEASAEIGKVYHASGYIREAEACWDLLLESQPTEPRWGYYLADLKRSESDYPAMASLLNRTLALAPDYAPAWLRLADYQLKTGQLDAAEASYERRLQLLPADPYAQLGRIRVAQQKGNGALARQLAEELVRNASAFSPGHNLLAEMLDASGDKENASKQRWLGRESARYREAEDPWLDELVAYCYNYQQLCIRGTTDFQSRHGDLGKASFERAIQLRPDEPTAYERLGALYAIVGEPKRAREVFETELQKARGANASAPVYVALCEALAAMQDSAGAARMAREGLQKAGDSAGLYEQLGLALRNTGDSAGAMQALTEAVKRSPRDATYNYNLSLALIDAGKLAEAVDALNRSLELQPTFPSSLVLLGQIEIDSGRLDSALRYLQPAYESHPELLEVRQRMAYWHLSSGEAREKAGDDVSAEKHYKDGIAIDDQQAELHEKLGLLYLRLGRARDAIKPLESFSRLDPKAARAFIYLAKARSDLGQRADALKALDQGEAVAISVGDPAAANQIREIRRLLNTRGN